MPCTRRASSASALLKSASHAAMASDMLVSVAIHLRHRLGHGVLLKVGDLGPHHVLDEFIKIIDAHAERFHVGFQSLGLPVDGGGPVTDAGHQG